MDAIEINVRQTEIEIWMNVASLGEPALWDDNEIWDDSAIWEEYPNATYFF